MDLLMSLSSILKRPTLSRVAFLLLFSAYIAVLLNIAFYRQVLTVMPLATLHDMLVFFIDAVSGF